MFKIEFSRNYAKLAIKVYVGKSNSAKKLPPLRMELVTSCVLADVLLTELNSSVLSQISDANCKCALCTVHFRICNRMIIKCKLGDI